MVTKNSQLLLPSVNIYSKYIETVKLKSLPSVTQRTNTTSIKVLDNRLTSAR